MDMRRMRRAPLRGRPALLLDRGADKPQAPMRGPPDAPRLRESQTPTVEAGVSRTNRAVIAPETLDRLVGALRRARLPRARPDGPRRRDRLRRARVGRRAADRLDRRAGRRHLPARAARRRGAVRLRRRPALVEALPVPAARAALAARRAERRARLRSRRSRSTRRRSRSSACARASCTRSRSRTASSSAAGTSTATTRPAATDAFVVAVNCFEPGGTCFCVSMGTGPKVEAGYDLALTELLDGEHRFLVEVGSERGAEVLAELAARPRDAGRLAGRRGVGRVGRARRWAGRSRPATSATCSTRNLEHPRWDEVADALPHLRQLHDGLPDLLLLDGRGRDRPRRRGGGALARLGLVLLGRLLVHPRRQRPAVGDARATGSG